MHHEKQIRITELSVLIPALNEARTLPTVLDALLDEGFIPGNIIVVDDGSVDETGNIIDRYAMDYGSGKK